MFERILDFIAGFWNVLRPWIVVNDFEGGVILRLGRFHRKLAPGLHWKLPIADAAITTSTVITTMALRPQTLTTRDDFSVVISAIVKYHIADVRAYLLDIWDSADVLNDVTLGAIKETIAFVEYADLQKKDIEDHVLNMVQSEAEKFGVHVHKVTFSDLGKVRSIRLITGEPSTLQ
jgi:regulator of protease activity HflC (stomatin/prohibitin superfamily)